MDLLDGVIRSYDWGSTTALADLRGVAPSGVPEAELWFGAHPSGPSTFRGDGRDVTADEMPFLVKVLAVERPLSLQAHPDQQAAVVGHRREDEAGLATEDPQRCFPDACAKPEMVCAIGRFETLCGFRPVDEAVAAGTTLGLPEAVVDAIRRVDWPTVVAAVLASTPDDLADLLSAAHGIANSAPSSEAHRPAAEMVLRLAELHPGDPALLLVPLLRHLVLADGDALFVAPGVLHAHLSGLAVEVMAVSDDVVRAGLTSTHVDPTALVEVLRSDRVDVVESPTGPVHRYAAGQTEDQISEVGAVLWRLAGDGLDVDLSDRRGPELVICTQGTALIGTPGDGPDLVVGSGEATWIGPDDGPARMRVDGTVHRVTVGEG